MRSRYTASLATAIVLLLPIAAWSHDVTIIDAGVPVARGDPVPGALAGISGAEFSLDEPAVLTVTGHLNLRGARGTRYDVRVLLVGPSRAWLYSSVVETGGLFTLVPLSTVVELEPGDWRVTLHAKARGLATFLPPSRQAFVLRLDVADPEPVVEREPVVHEVIIIDGIGIGD